MTASLADPPTRTSRDLETPGGTKGNVTNPDLTERLASTYATRMEDPKAFHATVLAAVDAEMNYGEIGEAIGIPRARVFDLVARARQLQR